MLLRLLGVQLNMQVRPWPIATNRGAANPDIKLGMISYLGFPERGEFGPFIGIAVKLAALIRKIVLSYKQHLTGHPGTGRISIMNIDC